MFYIFTFRCKQLLVRKRSHKIVPLNSKCQTIVVSCWNCFAWPCLIENHTEITNWRIIIWLKYGMLVQTKVLQILKIWNIYRKYQKRLAIKVSVGDFSSAQCWCHLECYFCLCLTWWRFPIYFIFIFMPSSQSAAVSNLVLHYSPISYFHHNRLTTPRSFPVFDSNC